MASKILRVNEANFNYDQNLKRMVYEGRGRVEVSENNVWHMCFQYDINADLLRIDDWYDGWFNWHQPSNQEKEALGLNKL